MGQACTNLEEDSLTSREFIRIYTITKKKKHLPELLCYVHIYVINLKFELSQPPHVLIYLSDHVTCLNRLTYDTVRSLLPEVQSPFGFCLHLQPSETGRSIAAVLQPQFICKGPANRHLVCSTVFLCNQLWLWTKSSPTFSTTPHHPVGVIVQAAGILLLRAFLQHWDMCRAMGRQFSGDHKVLCCPDLFIFQPFPVLNY